MLNQLLGLSYRHKMEQIVLPQKMMPIFKSFIEITTKIKNLAASAAEVEKIAEIFGVFW